LKKYFVSFAMLTLIAACGSNNEGSNNSSSDTTASAAPATNDVTTNPDYQKGLALVASNDCLTCHKVDEKVTGPAYRDVANKYENTPENVTKLADKIIKGGSGNWGTIPMTPHPALTEADAQQMVKYILLLRNK
jgi:cytochrome c